VGERENNHLPIVKATIEAQLGRVMHRVPQYSCDGPTFDLETIDAHAPSIAVEVKELVPADFLETNSQVSRDPGLDSKILTKRWSVVISEEPLSSRLAPMPNFPDDSPADLTEQLKLHGLHVVTQAERQEQWRLHHTLEKRRQVRISGLTEDIEPNLEVLERLGINQTGNPELSRLNAADFRAAFEALCAIKRRTGDAICMARERFETEEPGIDLCFGYGLIRTADPNVVVKRVQMWLDSKQSANLTASLVRSGADQKHGALWLSTEAESQSAAEQGIEFCPTLSLRLPSGLDVLWIFVTPLALRYDGSWVAISLSRAD
jgi:hypothetical protein